MILHWEDLEKHRGAAWAMVDGCFDPVHIGHLRYFEEAAKLGLPVFCNVQGDHYIQSKKNRPTILPQQQRAYLLHSLKTISHVHICEKTTADVLDQLAPKLYVKGGDWKTRGLPERELAICAQRGIEVVYLDTVLDSSTNLTKKFFNSYENLAGVKANGRPTV